MSAEQSPQDRLRLTRARLRELLIENRPAASGSAFPRSMTMRWLLGGGGLGIARVIPLATLASRLIRRSR